MTLKKKSFENIVRKGEYVDNQHFLLFPKCFLPIQKEHLLVSDIYFVICKRFNPFPNKPLFLRVCSQSLLKTLWEEEIAQNKQFLLFPQCFLSIWKTFCHFHQL